MTKEKLEKIKRTGRLGRLGEKNFFVTKCCEPDAEKKFAGCQKEQALRHPLTKIDYVISGNREKNMFSHLSQMKDRGHIVGVYTHIQTRGTKSLKTGWPEKNCLFKICLSEQSEKF